MVFSAPNIFYSQLGRGYALTICLSLAVVFFALKVEDSLSRWSWKWGLILSGLAMVLTLPSNIYFLLGCAVAFVFRLGVITKQNKTSFLKEQAKSLVPWAVLFSLVLVYFLLNWSDLQRGVKIYKEYARMMEGLDSLAFTSARIIGLFESLILPWGIWAYLLFFVGWGALKGDRILQPLFMLAIPIGFALSAEILGPPRSYLYWLPLVLILMANGIVTLSRALNVWLPWPRMKEVLVALVVVGVLWPAIKNLIDYYPSRLGQTFSASISEAKRMSGYIKRETMPHQIVVFPFADSVLRFFIEKQVAKKMTQIFIEENLNGLLFVGHKDIAPKNIPLIGIVKSSPLSDHSFTLVQEIGDLRVYKLDVQAVPLFATGSASDVQSRFDSGINSRVDITTMPSPWAGGRQMLVITKNGEADFLLKSNQSKLLKNKGKVGYVLSVFGRKFNQKSIAGILRSGNEGGGMAFLNYLSGIARQEGRLNWFPVHPYYSYRPVPDNLESFWRIEFSIMTLNSGEQEAREAFSLKDPVSYFDGFHSYLLYPAS